MEPASKKLWQRSGMGVFITQLVMSLASWPSTMGVTEWLDIHRVPLAGALLMALGLARTPSYTVPSSPPQGPAQVHSVPNAPRVKIVPLVDNPLREEPTS